MKRADVRLETGEAKVIYDDSKQAPEALAAAVARLGFHASVRAVTTAPKPTLYVDGLEDLTAVRQVERALTRVEGVKAVVVDPGLGEVFVEYDGQAVSAGDLLAVLERAGFRSRLAPR